MQLTVRRQHCRGGKSDRASVKRREASPGLFDDRHQRGNVKYVDVGLDDRVNHASAEQVIVEEVTVTPNSGNARYDVAPP